MGGMYFSDKLLFSKGNALIPVEVAARDRQRRQPVARKIRNTRSKKKKTNMSKNKRSVVIKASKSRGNINAININIGDREKKIEDIAPPRNFSQSFAPTIYQAPQVRDGDGRGGFVLDETMGDRTRRRERERDNREYRGDKRDYYRRNRPDKEETPKRGGGPKQNRTIVKGGKLKKSGGGRVRLWGQQNGVAEKVNKDLIFQVPSLTFGLTAEPGREVPRDGIDLTSFETAQTTEPEPENVQPKSTQTMGTTNERETQTMGTAATTPQRKGLQKVRQEVAAQLKREFEQSRAEQHRREEIYRLQQERLIQLQSKVRQRSAILEASRRRSERDSRDGSSGSDDFDEVDTPTRANTRARGSPLAATTEQSVTYFKRKLVANQNAQNATWSSMHGSPRSSPGPGSFRTRG